MRIAVIVFTALVALEHIYIMILEMFLWTSEIGLRTFQMTLEQAQVMQTLAKNQGLYNGFLAAGLIWSFFLKDVKMQNSVRLFFFACVTVAGVYGGITAKWSIILTQGMPAFIGLVLAALYHKQIAEA